MSIPSPDPKRIVSLYSSHYHRCYVASKLRTDPLYPAVTSRLIEEAPPVPLLDIGCGIGLFAAYLRESAYPAPVLGIDFDASKIAAAQRVAAEFPGLEFRAVDVRDGLPEFSGNVTVLDVLQYLPAPDQKALLHEAASRVASGGVLIVRSGLREPGWRFEITRAVDHCANLAFWMKSPPAVYPTRSQLAGWLEESGLTGEIVPLRGRTPFNNYLFTFRRAGV